MQAERDKIRVKEAADYFGLSESSHYYRMDEMQDILQITDSLIDIKN